MAYSRTHMLLQWGGSFTQSQGATVMDQFAGTLRFQGDDPTPVNSLEVCEELSQVLATWWSSAAAYISGFALLQWVKWNQIGTDGRYVSQDRTILNTLSTPVSGSQTLRYPLQIACVTTWLTSNERGRASRGRTYWPTSIPVSAQNNGRMAGSDAGNMALAAGNLIESLNGVLDARGSGLRASVMSDLGSGTSSIINAVRVGNRLDIQRRRDNSTEEIYQTYSLPSENGQP